MTRSVLLSGLAVLALLAGACSHSPPTTMLTLDAAPPPAAGPGSAYRGPPVAIPAVHVPAALDHANFVSQPEPGVAKIDDFAQWAAPLGILARDALVRDLTARLPAGSVLPPGAAAAGARIVDVTILSFASGPDGASLQAAYRALPNGPLRQVDLRAPGPAVGPVAGARALTDLMGQLADSMAADLAADPR